jgi:YHS domain-containing protein
MYFYKVIRSQNKALELYYHPPKKIPRSRSKKRRFSMAILSSKRSILILAGIFVVVVPVTIILAKSFVPSAMLIIGDSSKPVNTGWFGVAIKGYDTVAYHTEGRAIKGFSEYSHEWNDARWYFASAQNRDLFAADPERYAPQYGGY